MTALDYYRQLVDPNRLPQINLMLTDGPLLGNDGKDNTAAYSTNSHRIYIPPYMEWSEWPVAHETGHYFDGHILVDGGLTYYGRWGEAMANVRAGAILGTSWMTKGEGQASENLDVQGNWDEDAVEVVLENVSEFHPGAGYTWRILWDLHDGGGDVAEPIDFGYGQFDQWNGGGGSASPFSHMINGVVMEYLPQRNATSIPITSTEARPDPISSTCSMASPASTT